MAPALRTLHLAADDDFAGFRSAARALLQGGVPPEQVHWSTGEATLFDAPLATPSLAREPDPPYGANPADARSPDALRLPAALLRTISHAALHDDAQRFALIYRLLWRLQQQPALRHDPLDADTLRLAHMAQAVRRDAHKMKAFVRFRPVAADDVADGTLHVAWFEPGHHVVGAVGPFFARRFTNMAWAILTPRGSLRWQPPGADGAPGRLHRGPPARRADAPPADAGEALWLTYYQHIFNPARLKLSMMEKEMPRRYWHNLPEAALIAPLAAAAQARSDAMVAQPASVPARTVRLLPARSVPQVIASLDDLRAATARCRECPIGEHATQAVCGEGPVGAPLMLVGEQPGDQEDLAGRPFVGPAGQWLDEALRQLGIARESVYLANAVKHFKFELRGKRRLHKTAGQREAMACRHWMEDEIRLVRPKALVALGATAARALLGDGVQVTRDRGRWLQRGEDGLPVLVTLHPSALLRMDRAAQDEAWQRWLADLSLATQGPPA
ncbi:MAG: UdgX family uracil-DNA binding protein [Burkholderiales bacterium]|nr:UdgX family uracil-DNA binding protein [Burkholderiales bacterium]